MYEHNEKAYKSAVAMMRQYGKATIVYPTGTGKSHITFKLIENHYKAIILYLPIHEVLAHISNLHNEMTIERVTALMRINLKSSSKSRVAVYCSSRSNAA